MKKVFWLVLFLLFFVRLSFAKESGGREEIQELLGQAYVASLDNDNALQEYQNVLRTNPANTKARSGLADILSWQKKYDEAIVEYKKVLAAHPEDIVVQKKLAEVYVWKKDYPQALALYEGLISRYSKDPKMTISLAGTIFRLGNPVEAKTLLRGVLLKDPDNADAQILLADIHAGIGDFDRALTLYRKILARKYDRKIKVKIGDILSWTRHYREALKIYNELLAEKEDKVLRLQKARILGWERKYSLSRKEYQKILSQGPDALIAEEMNAKEFYWRNRVKHAIAAYKKLISEVPENTEAMFDLSQIYSYQAMWHDAIQQYKNLLDLFPDHFRAKQGLQKTELFLSHPVLNSGYEFFKAHSGARDVDIHKNVFRNLLDIPLNAQTTLALGYTLVRRSFLDHRDLTENQARIGLSYQKNPDWSTGAFFNLVNYYKGIAPVYEFGEQFSFRTLDIGQMTLSQEQQRLENNSTVIEKRLFRDNFKVRQDIDLTKRWKAGTDYTFSYFSDHNNCNEVAGDTLFFLSLEPRALYVKYRYAFRNFRKIKTDYFSPQEYSLHTISVRWKHFLNKEEVFFGAKDLYYEAGYDVSFDSTGITSHQVVGSLTWDITQRLQIKGEGQYTIASTKIYEDAGAKAFVKYYF